MHYCTSGIFFYETWRIIPNLMRKAFCKCALLSLFESISVLKKEFWIAIDISDRSTAHMVLLSASVLFFVIWIVIEIALAIIAYIYVFSQHSLYIPLLVVYRMLSFQTYICIDDMSSECSNLYASLHCDYSCEAIFEWLNIFYLFYKVIYMPDK